MDTRERIVEYVTRHTAERGFSPSLREIGIACGISSTSVVEYHLRRLEADGRVTRVPGSPRTLRVVEAADAG